MIIDNKNVKFVILEKIGEHHILFFKRGYTIVNSDYIKNLTVNINEAQLYYSEKIAKNALNKILKSKRKYDNLKKRYKYFIYPVIDERILN